MKSIKMKTIGGVEVELAYAEPETITGTPQNMPRAYEPIDDPATVLWLDRPWLIVAGKAYAAPEIVPSSALTLTPDDDPLSWMPDETAESIVRRLAHDTEVAPGIMADDLYIVYHYLTYSWDAIDPCGLVRGQKKEHVKCQENSQTKSGRRGQSGSAGMSPKTSLSSKKS